MDRHVLTRPLLCHSWDDWVPPDRLRKFTEENQELALNLKNKMNSLRQKPVKETKRQSTSSKKKAAGSDLSSARASEDRHSSVQAQPGARGQKRARDYEIEKVRREQPVHMSATNSLQSKTGDSSVQGKALPQPSLAPSQPSLATSHQSPVPPTPLEEQQRLELNRTCTAFPVAGGEAPGDDPKLPHPKRARSDPPVADTTSQGDAIELRSLKRARAASFSVDGETSGDGSELPSSKRARPDRPVVDTISQGDASELRSLKRTRAASFSVDGETSGNESELPAPKRACATPPVAEDTAQSDVSELRSPRSAHTAAFVADGEASGNGSELATPERTLPTPPVAEATAQTDVVELRRSKRACAASSKAKGGASGDSSELPKPKRARTAPAPARTPSSVTPRVVKNSRPGVRIGRRTYTHASLAPLGHKGRFTFKPLPTAGYPPEFLAQFKTAYNQQEEDFHTRPAVHIPIPVILKSLLVDDWENVTKNLQLVPLPSAHPVNVVLTDYYNHEAPKRRAGSAEADLFEEFVQGMRDYFNQMLGKILLYRFEREQFVEVRELWVDGAGEKKGINGPGDVYGPEHFIRLIGTYLFFLPSVLFLFPPSLFVGREC